MSAVRVVVPSFQLSTLSERERLGYMLLALPLFYVMAVTLVPLLFNAYASVQSWNFLQGEPLYVGLENYAELVADPRWLWSLLRTAVFVALAVSIELLLGFLIAFLLYRRFNNIRWLQALFLTPMMISEVAAALAWRLLLSGHGSLLNWVVGIFGIEPQLWLGPDWAFAAIVLVDVWQQTPFVVLVIFAALQGVPAELLEAAELDGAGTWRKIRHVIIPTILPSLSVVLIFRTVFALRVFTTVWILTGGGPGDKTAVLGVEIYRVAFGSFEIGMGAALSVVILVLSVVMGILYMRALGREALS
jgi:multiple sugar transport system permease protein